MSNDDDEEMQSDDSNNYQRLDSEICLPRGKYSYSLIYPEGITLNKQTFNLTNDDGTKLSQNGQLSETVFFSKVAK